MEICSLSRSGQPQEEEEVEDLASPRSAAEPDSGTPLVNKNGAV